MFLHKLLVVITASVLSLSAHSGLIKNEDIASINIHQAANWQTLNVHQLFDGIDDRYTPTRFAAYQKSGNLLSEDNVYNISVALVSGMNVSSIAFFNDWRHHLNQQVVAMNVALYGDNSRLLWNSAFSSLNQSDWQKVELVTFDQSIEDVMRIDFNITQSEGNHFEIRELMVSTDNTFLLTASNTNEINGPNMAALFLLGLGVLGYFRYFRSSLDK